MENASSRKSPFPDTLHGYTTVGQKFYRPYSVKMTLGIFAAMATIVPCM